MRHRWLVPVLAAAVAATLVYTTCAGPVEAPPVGGDEAASGRAVVVGTRGTTRRRADAPAPAGGVEEAPEGGVAPEPADDERSANRTAAPGDADRPRGVRGVVVDRATGKPIAGARVLYCHFSPEDPDSASWHGDTTTAEGRFEPSFDEDDDLSEGRLEVRVRKPGYEDVRRAPERAEMRIEMDAWDAPPRPGRVVGLVTDESGNACPGRLLVECRDDFGYSAQWSRADAGGSFVLEGMPPGAWRLNADGAPSSAGQVTVLVPDGGEARVHLVVDPTPVDPKQAATLEAATAQLDQIRQELDTLSKASESDRKRRLEEMERLRAGVAALTARNAKGRDVRVTGFAAARAGAVVRITPDIERNWFWRARVDGGAARFDDVPAGGYVLRIETPTGLEEVRRIEVPADGTGAVEIDAAAPK